ncbi:MAG: hypothetical protein KAU14_03025, partial [Thermoplasmata archaeon]|nr:hypothetical protein [Thermoplasmata archaeon]
VMNIEDSGSEIRLKSESISPWKARFRNGGSSMTLYPFAHEKTIVNLTVVSPSLDETLSGDTSTVWLRMTKPEEDSVNVTMVVKAVYNFTVTPIDQTLKGDQGATLNYTLEVNNTGNAVDIYSFLLSLPNDQWEGEFKGVNTFSDGEDTRYSLGVEPRDSAYVYLHLTLPAYADARNYSILVSVSSDHGEVRQTHVYAVVEPNYGVELSLEELSFDARDGENLPIEVEVINAGNIQDNLSMGLDGLPEGWSGIYSPSVFTLPPQRSKVVTLTLTIPPGDPTHEYTLTLTANSLEGGMAASEEIIVRVELQDKPDLIVSSISLSPEAPEEGKIVTITASVSNEGIAEAKFVVVQFFVDGELLGEETITSLSPGISRHVTKEWDPTKGDHTIRVVVDPAGDIGETDETNNDRTETVEVSGPSSSRNYTVIIFLVVLVIGGVVVYKLRPWEKYPKGIGERKEKMERMEKKVEREVDYTGERRKAIEEREPAHGPEAEGPAPEVKKSRPKITLEEEIFPIIIHCPSCKSKIRIIRAGKFRCPNCRHIGKLDETGELVKGTGPKVIADLEDKEEKEKQIEKKTRDRIIHTQDTLFPMKYSCLDCEKKSTVGEPGWHKCPFCGSVHYVDEEGELDNLSEEKEDEDSERKVMGLASKGEVSSITRETQEEAGEEAESAESKVITLDKVAIFPAVVVCPSCNTRVRVKSKGTYRCPECREQFEVGRVKEITSDCPWCGITIRVKRAGNYNCPSCTKPLSIEEDGFAGIEIKNTPPDDWRTREERNLSRTSLYTILNHLLPGLTRIDAERLHNNGFRSLRDFRDISEIDLALAGLDSGMAKAVKAKLDKLFE